MNGITSLRPAVLVGLLFIIYVLVGVGAPVGAAETIRISGVRTGVQPERTRIVLDLSLGGASWRIAEQTARGAVVLIAGVELSSGVRADLDGVGRIETGELAAEGDQGLRIALRFQSPSDLTVFSLADPPRLVLDVVSGSGKPGGGGGADPGAKSTPEPSSESEPRSEPKSEPQGTEKVGAKAPAAAETESKPAEPTVGTRLHEKSSRGDGVDLAPLPERRGPRIVVIDPGHGGEDPGATGPGLREKDVCLDVARRLHKALSGIDGIHPVLSRSRDVLVPLRQRMRLAEEVEADLFVSIHVNAATATNAQGVEVFFLSLRGASDEASRELAKSENEAISATSADPDAASSELPFSLSLRQSDTLLRSSRAAETVLDTFVSQRLAENRGVRQAAFVVLKSVEVPSILVELGFASSEVDREKLKQETHRQALADALASGISTYFEQFAPLRDAH